MKGMTEEHMQSSKHQRHDRSPGAFENSGSDSLDAGRLATHTYHRHDSYDRHASHSAKSLPSMAQLSKAEHSNGGRIENSGRQSKTTFKSDDVKDVSKYRKASKSWDRDWVRQKLA